MVIDYLLKKLNRFILINMICDVYIIRSFNEFLRKCHTAFDLTCIYLPTHWDIISGFIKKNADINHCHYISQDSAGTFAILATEKDSEYKDIVSYISIDSKIGIKTGKNHLKQKLNNYGKISV
jgi:hypothetical protein